jgi:hypothetical protein
MSRALKLILGTMLFGQAVMAQPPPPASPPAPAAEAPGVDVTVRKRPTITPQEMVRTTDDYRKRMTEMLQRLRGLVDNARRQKDIIRVNCLTDKVVQVEANMRTADQAAQALQEYVVRNDEAASVHEFTRITIVNQKVQVLGAEAEACVGEDLSYVGATRVDVDVEGLPDEDYTNPGLEPGPYDRPPEASPST